MVAADDIDALLPQTQCTRCGYNGCRPYAEAIAGGLAEINQCPPGGAATINTLATLLRREALPLNLSKARHWWPRSTRTSASVARSACHHARSTPSSVLESRCTPWSPSSAQVVS